MNSFRLSPTRYVATAAFTAGTAVALLGMKQQPAPRRPVPTLRIVAVDYGYRLPQAIPAGPTRLQLVNQGRELHHAQLARLEQGKTVSDVAALELSAGLPAWLVPVGGPGPVHPGDSTSVIQDLTPGHYALFCFIPSASDHKEHRLKGMIAGFRVTAGGGAEVAVPKADLTVRMLDYGYAPSAPLVAGRRNIRVVNDGPQLHELVLVQLPAGKTAADLLAWNPETATEPPPGRYVGGTVAVPVGGEAIVEANLEAGNYVLICYVPDAKDGKPHVAHGMVLPLTVQPSGE